jgi:hypothetical protein
MMKFGERTSTHVSCLAARIRALGRIQSAAQMQKIAVIRRDIRWDTDSRSFYYTALSVNRTSSGRFGFGHNGCLHRGIDAASLVAASSPGAYTRRSTFLGGCGDEMVYGFQFNGRVREQS